MGVNPKVNNLINGYSSAKHDVVWILDSNIAVNSASLSHAMQLLQQPNVGLVHHLPCGVLFSSLGSCMDAIFLNCTHARMYSTINRLGVASCVIGKSNLFRRSQLAEAGGLAYFGRFMAEDNIIGMAIMNLGLEHRVAPDLAYQSLGASTLEDYFSRRVRWTRIRKYAVTAATLYEPFSESIIAGLVAGWAFQQVLGTSIQGFFICNTVGWYLSDLAVALSIYPFGSGIVGSPNEKDEFRISYLVVFTWAWLMREVSALPVYIWSMIGSEVLWRGKRFYLYTDGTVEQLSPGKGRTRRDGVWLSISGPDLSPSKNSQGKSEIHKKTNKNKKRVEKHEPRVYRELRSRNIKINIS